MISSPGCGPDVEMGPKFQYHSRIQTTAHPLISILIPLQDVARRASDSSAWVL